MPPADPDRTAREQDRDHARPFALFISYAHAAEPIKDRLLVHLAPLRRAGLVSTWTDRAIPPGAHGREEIEKAIGRADAALFIVSADFLASGFCMDAELPAFLRRQRDQGKLILFLLAEHCFWEAVPAIADSLMIPGNGKPITAHHPRSRAYTTVVREIHAVLDAHRAKHGLPPRAAPPDAIRTALEALLAELPGETARLFGREADLQRIATRFFGSHRGVLLWVAPGGVGKSALSRWWVAHQAWPAGTHFIGHSFYSRGGQDSTISARAFLLRALADLGQVPEPTTSDQDLGFRLADRIASAPTLLVLDGLEPLQQTATDDKLNGRVKDQGLAALLQGLGRAPGQALCLATSRLPIPDPLIADQPAFRQFKLDTLPRTGAVDLLRARGLSGPSEQLDALAQCCADQPLTLILAAEVTYTFLDGDTQAFLNQNWPVPDKDHPDGYLAALMRWLDEGLRADQAALDRALLRALGVFYFPVPVGVIRALCAQGLPIAGVTEALCRATETDILESVLRLTRFGLVVQVDRRSPDTASAGAPTELDICVHSVVREYFARALESESPAGWRAARELSKVKNIFISYAREDLDAAKSIYNAILEFGGAPWMDTFDLRAGQDWAFEIKRAIEASDYFVACFSRRSNSKRGYVQKERKLALDIFDRLPEGSVFVVPIRLEEDCDIPENLKKWHFLSWTDPDRTKKLAIALGLVVPPSPEDTPKSKRP